MPDILFDGGEVALHPRLLTDGAVERWRGPGALRIERALAPGLAAELAPVARSLPHVIAAGAEPACLMWGCEIEVPRLDPQYPLCLFALARLVERDLPALAERLTGRRYAYAAPGRLRVWLVRKGCWLEPAVADGALHFAIGLAATPWPAAWGGHFEAVDDGGRALATLPPAADTIDLFAGRGPRLPLLTRQVEQLVVTGELVTG